MRTLLKLSVLLLLLLNACNLPVAGNTAEPITPEPVPDQPTEEYNYTECGFVWAREPLVELSGEFDAALKAVEPGASGHAEAYGENCLNNQGEVVRFLALETDFYVSLNVQSLEDKQALGELLEEVLGVVRQFPVESTPGSQPGYIGIDFEGSGGNILRLWIPQNEAESALASGLRGEDLFNALEDR